MLKYLQPTEKAERAWAILLAVMDLLESVDRRIYYQEKYHALQVIGLQCHFDSEVTLDIVNLINKEDHLREVLPKLKNKIARKREKIINQIKE